MKKDIFGHKLKLTKTEKAKHKSRMKKLEELSLGLIQIQRHYYLLYSYFIYLGNFTFRNESLKRKIFGFIWVLITKLGWLVLLPYLFQLNIYQLTASTLVNSHFI